MITYFLYLVQTITCANRYLLIKKRLGKNLSQIEPPDDLQLSTNLILGFAYA